MKEASNDEPWEIIVSEETIETTVCGPIKVRYRPTRNMTDSERAENAAAVEAEAMAIARMIVAAPAMHKVLKLLGFTLDQSKAILSNDSYFVEQAKSAGDLIRDAIKDIE